jgi:hypothetical protein
LHAAHARGEDRVTCEPRAVECAEKPAGLVPAQEPPNGEKRRRRRFFHSCCDAFGAKCPFEDRERIRDLRIEQRTNV